MTVFRHRDRLNFPNNFIILHSIYYFENPLLLCRLLSTEETTIQSEAIQVRKQRVNKVNSEKSIPKQQGHIKSLLFKINSIREELESFDQSNDEISDIDDLIEHFREFHKGLPLTFFSQYPLDDKMLGPFVMRITKEMGYWRKLFPFLALIISDIDEIFEQQKKNEAQNISLIYFMTIKKITSECTQFFKSIKTKILQCMKKQSQQEKQVQQANILMVPYFQQSMNGEYLKSIKEDMQKQMEVYINKLYYGLQVISFAAIDDYATDLNKENNVQVISKKLLIRNRKIKKQVKAYKIMFKEFRKKKQQKKRQKLILKNRLVLKSQQKDLNLDTLILAPSLSKKSSKVTLPSIKSSEKELDISGKKKKVLKSGNKSSNLSLPKKRKGTSKIRLKASSKKLKL